MMSSKNTCDTEQQQNEIENVSKNFKVSVFKGLILAQFSGVLYASASVVVKRMENIYPGQLALYRYLAVMAFSFPGAVKCKENLLGPKNFRFMLIINAILSATSMFLAFLAFRYLPLGESAVIVFSLPVFVTVAARIFLREPCKIFQFITVLMTVVGIVFTTKIPQNLASSSVVYTKESVYGLLSAIGSLIFSTCSIIVIRQLKGIHHSVVMFSYGWIPILETVILTAIVGDFQMHNCGIQSLYIIIIGILGYTGYMLTIKALQCEMAGPVSTVRAATDIVLAFLFQILFFHDISDIYSSVGAVLVGVSIIFVGLEKWISSLSEESIYRKKLSLMLK